MTQAPPVQIGPLSPGHAEPHPAQPGIPHAVRGLLARWETMLRIRRAEEAIAQMVESGEAGCPCHLCIGQEAVAAGVCAALTQQDTVWGGHRSHGHYLAKGGSIEALFAEILGKVTGCSRGRGGSMHLAAPNQGVLGTVPVVAATVSLAVGAGMAYRMRGEPHVAVAFFGDGALEEGSVHESMNLAALYRAPVLFVCENNLYSSHLHWSRRRVSGDLDRAGEFHSVGGERVDGNDVEAVYQAALAASARARAGSGPAFLECRTFRWRGHVGASYDLDVGVKRRGELREWQVRDPLRMAEARLAGCGLRDLETRLATSRSTVNAEIERALEAARRAPTPDPARVLDYVWRQAAGAPAPAPISPELSPPVLKESACAR